MILYNVTVKIEKNIEGEWVRWMQQVHIPDVMKTGLFREYKLCRLLLGEDDGVTFAVQYLCDDLSAFKAYQDTHAAELQKAHSERFPNKFVAFRTLMEVLQEGLGS